MDERSDTPEKKEAVGTKGISTVTYVSRHTNLGTQMNRFCEADDPAAPAFLNRHHAS